VPVIRYDGETVQDSTAILEFLGKRIAGKLSLTPKNEEDRRRCTEIEAWADEDLAQVLPTVIYGTWSDSTRAAQITAKNSNFGFVQNMLVRAGGSVVMHQIAKRIIAKRGGKDPEEMLQGELDRLESWITDDGFVCGDSPTIGDAAAHGVLKCIEDFPAFAAVKSRPRIYEWFERMDRLRAENRAV
jgi:microsomal prostaglandin-E synthase 2